MSGLDEQISDIPKCPECGGKPWFWILSVDNLRGFDSKWLWLFGNDYLITEKESHEKRISNYSKYEPFCNIDDVISVQCRPKDDELDHMHKFEVDSPTFNEVIKYATIYWNRGNKSKSYSR